MSTNDENGGGLPDIAGDSGMDAQFKTLAEHVARTADSDLKAFLSGVLKATEVTLADLKSMRERLDRAQADADAATLAEQRAKRDASDTAFRSNIRAEAQAAGAVDAADVLAFVRLDEVKLKEDGKSNIGELINALKKSKPHLFGKVNTSAAHPVPRPAGAASRNALEMTIGEYRAAKARFTRR